MPIKKVEGGGYRWGKHGKVYKDRKGAEKQAAAAYANGYKGDPKGYKEGGKVKPKTTKKKTKVSI